MESEKLKLFENIEQESKSEFSKRCKCVSTISLQMAYIYFSEINMEI